MAEPVIIILSDDDEDAAAQPGQTKDNAISIDKDGVAAPQSTESAILIQFSNTAPQTANNAAQMHLHLPETNGTPRAALSPAPQIHAMAISNGLCSSQPLKALPYHQSPKPNRPPESLLPAHQTPAILPNIPLPKFHEMPTQPSKVRLATPKASKATSRPHPGSSAGFPKSPDRKRMRLSDSNVSRAPSVGGYKHQSFPAHNGRSPLSSQIIVQQSATARLSGDHKSQSAVVRTHNVEMKRSPSPQSMLSQAMSTGSKKRDHSALADDDMFPLRDSIGDDRLRSISGDVHSRLIDPVAHGQRAIYRILSVAKSMSDLADQILGNFVTSENKALAQEIKANFDQSLKNLQEEHGNAVVPKDFKAAWVTAAIYHAINLIGKMPLPEPQPMPERDATASQVLKGTVNPAIDQASPSVERTDEEVDTITLENQERGVGKFIKKAAHYGEVDVLRLKGMVTGSQRPYMTRETINLCQLGAKNSPPKEALKSRESRIISVPFLAEERDAVHNIVLQWYNDPLRTTTDIEMASKSSQEIDNLSTIASYIASRILYRPTRSKEEYAEYLKDFESITEFLRIPPAAMSSSKPVALVRKRAIRTPADSGHRASDIQRLLRNREMATDIDRSTQQLQSLVLSQLDDSFTRDVEFSGGPGDIANFTWLSEDDFISGAITNCDLYNQDYNKPGNIVMGSAKTKVARAIPGHRVPRPLKPHKKDALAIDSQDPWLYTSVPMTAFDHGRNLCFTAAYDKTVKIWRTTKDELSMDLLGIWYHDGHVNLIVNSPHHSKVATASDVKCDGIRVYDLAKGDVGSVRPRMYSGSRARECADRKLDWAYYPATMQWGLSEAASHFLAVGYSPRALEVHSDVPWDKKNSGQLCVWDTFTKAEVSIAGPKAQNVFEVVWHPSQVVFVAATSAAGDHDEGIKTQLRLFVYKEASDAFAAMKTFECFAADINEITLRPSSYKEVYLTASCTDRKTYVWDSVQGCYPTHILCHDAPIDQIDERADAEEVDAGVKFAAWGRTVDRFFTGSSDGVLKAWNIRAPRGEEFLGDFLFASGGISCGSFSPDRTRLAIGDTSGKIHLMTVWDEEVDQKPVYIRTAIRPFYEPAPPNAGGVAKAHEFVVSGQVELHRDKYIGAIQGPNYAATKLYRPERHIEGDLQAIPLDVLRGQKDRRYREIIIVPRLPSAKDVHLPQSKAASIFERLCSCGFAREDARLVASRCGAMGMGLSACAEIFKDKLDIIIPLPDSYEPEAEVGDTFQKDRSGSSVSREDHPSHYLSGLEVGQFSKLRHLIASESFKRKTFQQVREDFEA